MPVPKNVIDDVTVAKILDAVGFTKESAVVAFAVLVGESGLDEFALNLVLKAEGDDQRAHKSLDMGIAQFNSYWHPEITVQQAMDALWSIAKFYEVSGKGSDFSPWTAWDNLTFVRHIERAYRAFADAGITVR